jgi:CheY-like chemotaxis protein
LTFPPILLLEDDEGQSLLIRKVLSKAGLANPVQAFTNGDRAVEYLEGKEPYEERSRYPFPALVLLDAHVHGRSGLDVLAWIREHPDLRSLPVLMLSGSGDSEDIDRAFKLGVDSYLVKPVAFDALMDAVTSLNLSWAILGRAED